MWLWHKSYGLNVCLSAWLYYWEILHTNYSSVIFILYYYYHVILFLYVKFKPNDKNDIVKLLTYGCKKMKPFTSYKKGCYAPGARYFLFVINIIDLSFTGLLPGGHSLKICDGYVRPHWPPFSNRLSLNDPLFMFSHLLSPNDPHFQNAPSLNDPLFRNIYRWKWASCSHWMTPIFANKWPPRNMYPIFVWKEGFM